MPVMNNGGGEKTGFGCNLGPGQELFTGRVKESEMMMISDYISIL